MGNAFSVPIFFIVFRETIEAAIIISVLLSLVDNLVERGPATSVESTKMDDKETATARRKRLTRRMRLQVWAGALLGLLIALCIGAAFIAVFFTTLNDIWTKNEEIWEGTFSLLAALIIFPMGVTMLRIDRSKVKWQQKLEGAFDKKADGVEGTPENKGGRSGKWALFLLPLITVLREGLEAVVFVGGVSLGQSAKSIPAAAIVGLACGLIFGYIIYASSGRLNLTVFLIVSTDILFLLGAGLFSKGVNAFERYRFNKGVGKDVAELGDGPGSYRVQGNVWHLTYGNPEVKIGNQGWSIFKAILGWTNSATYGSILSYVFYWVLVIGTLVYMKWSEGRTTFFGIESAAAKRRRARQDRKEMEATSESVEEKAEST